MIARWPLQGAMVGLAILASAGMAVGQDSAPATGEGEASVSTYALADAFLANGEAAAACTLVGHVYGLDTDDPGALLRLASCSLALERPRESLAYLQRVSALDPDDSLLQQQILTMETAIALADLTAAVREQERLEAALAETARRIAEASVVVPPSPAVLPVAEQPLPPPQFSGRASLQRFFNSNVNSGTYNDSFIGLGLPLTVAPAAKETADWGTRIGVDGSVIVPLDWRNAVQFNAALAGTVYDVESSHSRVDALLSGGWITGTNQAGAVLRPHLGLGWVDGIYDRLAIGLEASGHLQIAPATTLVGSVDATHRWQHNALETGWLVGGSLGIRRVVAPGVSVGGNVLAERAVLAGTAQSYWRVGPEVYVNAALTDTISLNLNAGVDFVGFDGSLPIFPTAREDVQYRVGTSLNWALPEIAEGLSLQASYSFSQQQSNQGLYDTHRHLTTLSLGYAF